MATTAAERVGRVPSDGRTIYAFEAPVRMWHWVNAGCIAVLAVTGYLIANPLPTVVGEASDHFIMGRIRLIHFVAGYCLAIGFAGRVYWALVGNAVSRQIFYLPVWRGQWWRDFFREIAFYLFLTKESTEPPGHNPLAQTGMLLFVTLGNLFMICTGFAMYAEGLGRGSWADRAFGWVVPLIGDSERVHNLHNLGMWVIVSFVIIHIYLAVRGDIVSRHSSTSTIISGYRMRKGGGD
jgi:Ni/Fe-hydrogenase 1 B-type cytochrome subunit